MHGWAIESVSHLALYCMHKVAVEIPLPRCISNKRLTYSWIRRDNTELTRRPRLICHHFSNYATNKLARDTARSMATRDCSAFSSAWVYLHAACRIHSVAADTPLPCRIAELVQGYCKTIRRWWSTYSSASSTNRALRNPWINSAAMPTRAWSRPIWSSTCLTLHTQSCARHTTSAVCRQGKVDTWPGNACGYESQCWQIASFDGAVLHIM